MTCSSYKKNLTAYLYGELPIEEVMALHQHLGTCGKCAAEEWELRQTMRQVDKYGRVALPSNFEAQLNTKLALTREKSFGSWYKFRRVALAIAATLIITLGIEIFAYEILNSSFYLGNIQSLPTTQAVFKPARKTLSTSSSWKDRLQKKFKRRQAGVFQE